MVVPGNLPLGEARGVYSVVYITRGNGATAPRLEALMDLVHGNFQYSWSAVIIVLLGVRQYVIEVELRRRCRRGSLLTATGRLWSWSTKSGSSPGGLCGTTPGGLSTPLTPYAYSLVIGIGDQGLPGGQ